MTRIAQIIGVTGVGGVESVIFNYYKYIDKSKFQFDFFVEQESKIIDKEVIESLGGRVFLIPHYTKLKKFEKVLKVIFKENKYKIVHSNLNSLSVFPLRIAKKCGVPIRIAHSHSTSNKKEKLRNFIKNILRKYSKKYSTDYLACSKIAGEWLFGHEALTKNQINFLPNAVDIKRFKFNVENRLKIRSFLNIDDNTFLIGHVGRFMKQKNHAFIVDLFRMVSEKHKNIKLCLVGEGDLKEDVKEKARQYGLEDKIIFVDPVSNIQDYYSAFDLFLLPSLYEGMPLSAVEAQISGLNCLISDKISDETICTNKIKMLSLENFDDWLTDIENLINKKDNDDRVIRESDFAKYDISQQVKTLEKYYEKLLSKI